MKSAEFAEFFAQCSKVFIPSQDAQPGLEVLTSILLQHDKTPVAKVLENLAACEAPLAANAASSWGPSVDVLSPFAPLLQAYAKPAVTKDFLALIAFLSERRQLAISEFASFAPAVKKPKKAKTEPPPIRTDLVQKYNRLLERALGDDPGFKEVVREIDSGEVLFDPELIQLAKQFALASTKSRSAALKKIQSRQDALMTSRAKSNATAGRVAG